MVSSVLIGMPVSIAVELATANTCIDYHAQQAKFRPETACEVSGHEITDHFAEVGKMLDLGSGSQREIDDVMLTRYAQIK